MEQSEFEQVLRDLTPSRLRDVILAIAATQKSDNREGVTLGPIMEALSGVKELGQKQEGWARYLKLKRAIMDAVTQIPGMKYVEADA